MAPSLSLLGKTAQAAVSTPQAAEKRLAAPLPLCPKALPARGLHGSSLPASRPLAQHVARVASAPQQGEADKAAKDKAAGGAEGKKPVKTMAPIDGCEAVANVAYALSDVSFIYPITPSTPMGELADAWAAEGRTNAFGNVMQVTEMESETGAAGALHGALAAGALSVSFTCSQGLLLMVPNMYKIAGELTPCVLHVTARALAKHALSIFGDHQDVMAVRPTGWSLLCSHSVQEAQDLALVAHLATLRTSVPFLHFFDGFRTSHEINKIKLLQQDDIKKLIEQPVYQEAIKRHRSRALNPTHPHQRGTAQGPEIYFQCAEAANPFYNAVPEAVATVMEEVSAVTGRPIHLFDYYGAPDADRVVVMMGSGSPVVEEAVNYLNAKGQKVGVLKVRLYRPWSAKHFLAALPSTCKRISVLDRTKESGSLGEPLYLDVVTCLAEAQQADPNYIKPLIVNGRYGLGSKDFTPGMAIAVFDNLSSSQPKRGFTVGIVDDVTFTSLNVTSEPNCMPAGTTQAMFWGMGSDGTVGANKEAVKIIADATDMYAQAYFAYDAHKSGGVTVSHLRFGPSPITCAYLVDQADYLGVHHQSYLNKFDCLSKLKPGGVLVFNSAFTTVEQLDKYLTDKVKRDLARLQPKFYAINARACADSVGLGKRVNMVMQTVFFYLSGVLPMEQALGLLKKSIAKAYGKKGPDVVAKNQAAVDEAVKYLCPIDIPASWATIETKPLDMGAAAAQKKQATSRHDFITEIALPMLAMEGDKLPVSIFGPEAFVPPGTTEMEKRAIASNVPIWIPSNCTQCNMCAFVCPHAAIRPGLLSKDEASSAPFEAVQAKGAQLKEWKFRIQVTPVDCTGCELCVHACPDAALAMKPVTEVMDVEEKNWEFFKNLPIRDNILAKEQVKGSQLQQPLMEFSGACEGCGETPYVKLLTQLFGDRLIIANATGCSSIWGGSSPSNPYTTNADGYGPAWANSLFEDNAQFGLGIAMATVQRRKAVAKHVKEALSAGVGSETIKAALTRWSEHWQEAEVANVVAKELQPLLEKEKDASPLLTRVYNERDMLHKPSIWIVGGDGWAYDIGFGGLDHVLASGEDVNILVLDTEMYSNTGGQRSKATPLGAVTKFAAGGKDRPKKDLGQIAMSYGDVYVASTALQANFGQVVKAMAEAEKYPGVSLVMAYAPCVMQGITEGMCGALDEAKAAVDTGYWELYRFNPSIQEDGTKHRFQLDSKKALKGDLEKDFIGHENRFNILTRKNKEVAAEYHHKLDESLHKRHKKFQRMATDDLGWQPS